jgi:outer membrane biosynthesis protein TonB
VTCPNCGKEVELGKKTCPHCGFPLGLSSQLGSSIPQQVIPAEEQVSQPTVRREAQPKARSIFIIGIAIALFAIGISFFMFSMLRNKSGDSQPSTKQIVPPLSNMTITFSEITVSGSNAGQPGRSYTEICQAIYQHSLEFNDIYNEELAHDPTLQAKLQVSFNINNDGKVSEVNVTSLGNDNAQLQAKVKSDIYQWQFAPANGAPTTVAFALSFNPSG